MLRDHGRSLRAALVLPALLLGASTAFAQDPDPVRVFGNETDYAAATGADIACIDFSGSTGGFVPGDTFSADVAFGSPEAADPTLVNWSSDALSDGGSVMDPGNIGPVDGTFTTAVHAFKFVFLSNAVPATVDLYAEDSSLIASFTAPAAPGFCGILSTTPVKRFVLTPGVFDPLLGNRDRFFIDDFCISEGPAEPPPAAADPAALCGDLADAVAGADASAFRGRNRQRALGNKMRVICERIDAGDAESLCAALRKLERDLMPKWDGARSPRDWVVDATVQQDLADRSAALAAALADAIEALGGCPEHDDGGDDGQDNGTPPEDPGSQGQGGGHGSGHGRGHAYGRR